MNKIRSVAAIAAISAAVGSPGIAAADTGFYLGLSGGLNFQNEVDGSFEAQSFGDGFGGTAEFDDGFALSGTAGYKYDVDPNKDSLVLRPELEVSYRQNSADSLTINNPSGDISNGTFTNFDGDISSLTGMANLWLDYEIGDFTPYVGGGIGMSQVTVDADTAGGNLIDDDDTVFAYQLGVGAAYSLTQQVALTVDYRFFSTAEASLQLDDRFTDQTFDGDTSSHTTMVGLRYSF